MNNFCTNCGEKLHENAAFCIKCGVAINNTNLVTNTKTKGKGLGIASMVLGIIGSFTSFMSLFLFVCLLVAQEYFVFYEKIILAFVFLSIPIILSITGLVLGLVNQTKVKSGINLTGVILGFISAGLCVLSILTLILV